MECRLIEVKGPSDHLSQKQLLWLQIFQVFDIPSFVGRVKGNLRREAETVPQRRERKAARPGGGRRRRRSRICKVMVVMPRSDGSSNENASWQRKRP